MIIDPSIISAIEEMCEKEEVPQASKAIIKFVRRYLSNELPGKSINEPLQDIYDLMKGSIE